MATKKKGEGEAAPPKGKQEKPAAKAAPVKVPPPPKSAPVAGAMVSTVDEGHPKAHGFRRKLIGRVTSDKMNKTVTVEVVRSSMDPVYKKIIRTRARYKAHDETNQYKTGDRVEIQEHRPISRNKRWLVTKLVARRVEE